MTSNHILLYRLAELMLEHEQYILPVDLLFDDDQIGDFVKSIQIDSPYQQMLIEGVLTESVHDEKLYVSFTVEGYFHYVLGEVIYHRTEGLGAEALKQIVEENKLNGAKEGVEQCLIRDVQKDDLTRLMWLIDEGGEVLDICCVPLVSAFLNSNGNPKTDDEKNQLLQKHVNDVINKMQINISENDINILGKAINYLEEIQKNSIITIVYKAIKRLIKPQSSLSILLCVKSIEHIPEIEREEYLSFLSDLKIEIRDNLKSHYYYEIAKQYEVLSDYKRVIINLKKSITHLKSKKNERNQFNLATLHNEIGLAYIELGLFEKSFAHLTKSLSIRKVLNTAMCSRIAEANNSFGIYYYNLGDYDTAIRYFKLSLKLRIMEFGNSHPYVGATISWLGQLYYVKGNYNAAIKNHLRAFEIYSNTHSEHDPSLSRILNSIAMAFSNKGEYSKAIDFYEKSLKIKLIAFGQNHISTATAFNNLALNYNELGRKDLALEYYKTALGIFVNLFDENHPSIGTIYGNIGTIYYEQHENESAILYFKKGLSIALKFVPKSHPDVGIIYTNLGCAFQRKNDVINAKKYYNDALKIFSSKLGIEHEYSILVADYLKELNDL